MNKLSAIVGLVSLFGLALSATACVDDVNGGNAGGGGAGGGHGKCIPDKEEQCACPGGQSGKQPCNSEGTGFGPCECGDADADAGVCTPGQQVGCACPGGSQGVQKCKGNGSGFDTCECPPSTSSSSSGGTGGVCTPGAQTSCTDCPNEGTGVHVCNQQGTGFGACTDCTGGSTSSSSSSGGTQQCVLHTVKVKVSSVDNPGLVPTGGFYASLTYTDTSGLHAKWLQGYNDPDPKGHTGCELINQGGVWTCSVQACQGTYFRALPEFKNSASSTFWTFLGDDGYWPGGGAGEFAGHTVIEVNGVDYPCATKSSQGDPSLCKKANNNDGQDNTWDFNIESLP